MIKLDLPESSDRIAKLYEEVIMKHSKGRLNVLLIALVATSLAYVGCEDDDSESGNVRVSPTDASVRPGEKGT